MQYPVGTRLRSAVDDTQVIVIRSPARPVDVTCGGHPLQPIDTEVLSAATISAGHDCGTVVGKRYVDEGSGLEMLCTKSGVGALFADDNPMTIKVAKALPASD